MDDVISRERLYELVWTKPMLKVAAQFEVSSSYMARVCTVMNVPRPERGYWAKHAFGKTEKRPPLPAADPQDLLAWGRGADLSVLQREPPKLPPKSAGPRQKAPRGEKRRHPLIDGVKGHFGAGRESHFCSYLKPAKRNLVDLAVSKGALDRALSFGDSLFQELEDRGYTVCLAPTHECFQHAEIDPREGPKSYSVAGYFWTPARCTVVYLGTLAVGLTIFELSEERDAKVVGSEYVALDAKTADRLRARDPGAWWLRKHDFASGRLCLQAYSPYWVASWTRQWREEKVGDLQAFAIGIVDELVAIAPEVASLVAEGQRKAIIEHEKQEEDFRQWERKNAEEKRANANNESKQQLLRFIESWAEAKRIQEFFANVEAELAGKDPDAARKLRERLALARDLVGQLDPARGLREWKTPQELLKPDEETKEA